MFFTGLYVCALQYPRMSANIDASLGVGSVIEMHILFICIMSIVMLINIIF